MNNKQRHYRNMSISIAEISSMLSSPEDSYAFKHFAETQLYALGNMLSYELVDKEVEPLTVYSGKHHVPSHSYINVHRQEVIIQYIEDQRGLWEVDIAWGSIEDRRYIQIVSEEYGYFIKYPYYPERSENPLVNSFLDHDHEVELLEDFIRNVDLYDLSRAKESLIENVTE